MGTGTKVAIGVGAYLAVGAIVAVWTADRSAKGKTAFSGFALNEKPVSILTECVLFWPYAAFRNLVPDSKDKISKIEAVIPHTTSMVVGVPKNG